jgi:hypothetical protein
MAWTVHRLKSVLLSRLFMNEENILSVFEIMATQFPQFRVVEIRRDDFAISPNFVLSSHEFD